MIQDKSRWCTVSKSAVQEGTVQLFKDVFYRIQICLIWCNLVDFNFVVQQNVVENNAVHCSTMQWNIVKDSTELYRSLQYTSKKIEQFSRRLL